MGFEEMVVAIIGTVAGVGLLGFVIAKITSLIKSWIERNKSGYDEETFNRLAKAFMQHKKDTERRLRNLEAIITDENASSASSSKKQLEEPHETIEIEDTEKEGEQQNKSKSETGSDDRNLRNMLRN